MALYIYGIVTYIMARELLPSAVNHTQLSKKILALLQVKVYKIQHFLKVKILKVKFQEIVNYNNLQTKPIIYKHYPLTTTKKEKELKPPFPEN